MGPIFRGLESKLEKAQFSSEMLSVIIVTVCNGRCDVIIIIY